MRSYYAHLESTASPLAEKKPTLRSSAIFPLFQDNDISTRVIFLGYWQLKRKISDVHAHVFIRDIKGNIVAEKKYPTLTPKAYSIEASEIIPSFPFTGTIEAEFHSSTDLVFPYPATAVNYYGPAFSSAVHTAQRTYNDAADEKRNSSQHVPESGLTIYCDKNREPFISFINGRTKVPEQNIKVEFHNSFNESYTLEVSIPPLNPYELTILHPHTWFDLESFLKGKAGTCKIDFSLKGVFPRLLAGNILKKPRACVVTHTYYDCSKAATPTDFWTPNDPNWHPASLALPIFKRPHTISVDLYPAYSPSSFTLDLEIYNRKGELLHRKENWEVIEAPFHRFLQIPLDAFSSSNEPLGGRIIAHSLSDEPIPARIKVAIDVGVKDKALPTNICTNLQPYVPAFSLKSKSFKWLPILADQEEASIFVMNTSPEKKFTLTGELQLDFYREQDSETMQRKITLPPHGFLWIHLKEEEELRKFFGGKVGWLTVTTNNPYTTSYYFAENKSGVIGGDHGF